MSRLAKLSLAYRSLVALLSIAIIGFGVIATGSLKQELIPSLQLPGAFITTVYPGASPDIVEREVTEKVESAISGTEGLESYTSTSSNGMSSVQVQLEYGTDIDSAVQNLQQSLNRIQNDLPDDAESTVGAGSTDDFPVVVLAVKSDASQNALVEQLESDVVPELKKISGVRDAEITGARQQRVTVDLDKKKLAAAKLSPQVVANALKANGVSIPGGDLTSNGTTVPVSVGKTFDSVEDVRSLPLGPSVQLDDVATVEESVAPSTTLTRTDGKPTLGLTVTKLADADTVKISHDVKAELDDLEKKLGDNTSFTVIFDQAPFIEESVEGLTTEGMLGLLMAVLVILLFLLSLRSTLVTAVSIPMSLLVAMIGLYSGGYSLNILTLGALTVAVGRVVDDSIVVLENIKRHLSYGEEKTKAILAGVREVAGAVTASTITTVGVFLPIAFVGGQVGELFRPFAVTVTVALLASLLVSLTIIPVLAYWFMRRPKAVRTDEAAEAEVHEKALEKERRSILQRIYVPVIRFSTKHKAVTLLLGLAVFIGTMAMGPLLKTNFLDQSGQNLLTINQVMPTGTSLNRTSDAAEKVEDVLKDTEGVRTYQVTIGSESFGGFTFGGGVNEATYSVSTDDKLDTDEQLALEKDLRKKLDGIEDAGDISLQAGGGGGPQSSNLEVIVKATNDTDLEAAAGQVESAMKKVDGATDVTNNLASDMPSIEVDVDREKAAAAGLSEAQIGGAVRQAFQGETAGNVLVDGSKQDIVLENGKVPGSLDTLRDLTIPSATGKAVKLDSVADISRTSSPASLSRIDGERSATITATPTGSNLGAVNTELQQELDKLDLPASASYEMAGVSSDQSEAFSQLGLALLAAIVIVFAVMVATFRSVAQSLVLLVSIPFAATGALGLLLLTDTALGVPALIGMLMLIGIVVTNAIVLIDLINQYRGLGSSPERQSRGLGSSPDGQSRESGMPLREAVIEGGRRRLRPILMTAIATICALVPMSLGLTGGGVFISKPLAIVVIGGLVSSTLLTLVLVPTLYTMVEGFKERRRARRAARRGEHARDETAVEEPADVREPAHAAAPARSNGTGAPTPHVVGAEGNKVTIEVVVRNESN